jgi:hypothetical protein
MATLGATTLGAATLGAATLGTAVGVPLLHAAVATATAARNDQARGMVLELRIPLLLS